MNAQRFLKVGDSATRERLFSPDELQSFMELSAYGGEDAVDSIPEPLLAGLISDLLGTQLPGYGTNYLKQDTRFLQSASIGTKVVARVEVTRIRPHNKLINLKTECRDEDGNLLNIGEALVKFPPLAFDD